MFAVLVALGLAGGYWIDRVHVVEMEALRHRVDRLSLDITSMCDPTYKENVETLMSELREQEGQ